MEPTCLLLLPKSPQPLYLPPFWGCWIRAGCWGAGAGSGGPSLFPFFWLSFIFQLFSKFAFDEKRDFFFLFYFFLTNQLTEILAQLMTCRFFVFPTFIARTLLDVLKQHLHIRASGWIKYVCNGIQPQWVLYNISCCAVIIQQNLIPSLLVTCSYTERQKPFYRCT